MGRYYNGDVEGKFMFAVQGSDAHERFGAVEEESNYINYVVYRDSYAEICAELDAIKHKGHIDKVEKMFSKENGFDASSTVNLDKFYGWNDEILARYNVTLKNLSEYADHRLGMQLKEFFDNHPNADECRFEAEL